MTYSYDPEITKGLLALAPRLTDLGTAPAAGDVEARRVRYRRVYHAMMEMAPSIDGVEVEHFELALEDGYKLRMLWYRSSESALSRGAVLFFHGGGYFTGFPDMGVSYDWRARTLAATSGVPVLLVDYRLAPEHPYPMPQEDCYAALLWLSGNAQRLGVDAQRIAVLGNSAGGGLAASVALLARDRGGPPIAQQMLLCPMLDDRTPEVDPEFRRFLTWTVEDDVTGWQALIGTSVGGDVPCYAAPARATDLSGLPPAYIEVGGLDFLRDQAFEYGRRLNATGVPTELHSFPGCPHSFEAIAPDAAVSRLAVEMVARRLRSM